MRLRCFVTGAELGWVIDRLAQHDAEEVFIADDRGGTGCWVVTAQGPFIPDLGPGIDWEPAPETVEMTTEG